MALRERSAPAQARSKANVSRWVGPQQRIGGTSALREAAVVEHLSSGPERTSGFPFALSKSGPSGSRKSFVAWHPGSSYSLAMQTKEAFHTETPNPFHRTDSLQQRRLGLHFILGQARAASASRSCQTLGVFKRYGARSQTSCGPSAF